MSSSVGFAVVGSSFEDEMADGDIAGSRLVWMYQGDEKSEYQVHLVRDISNG